MAEFVLYGQELFGRYARIAYGHALGGEQDYHIYKCIQSFRSNCYCDVPLTYQTENNCYNHENIVDVVNVIHCGIDENRVIRVALNDIELLPAADVEPVKEWVSVKDRLPEANEYVMIWAGEWQIAKIEKGISGKERELMKNGEIDDPVEVGWNMPYGYFQLKRSESYRACDEGWNNSVPYCWYVNGGMMKLFGQSVTHWMPLPAPPKGE